MARALSIEELAQAADVPVRTVRYYISEGLLSGPGGRGRAATYDDEHLGRLQLIRRLVDQHVPLAEVRKRLAQLSGAEVESLLRTEQRREAALRRASQTSPQDYISGLLNQARRARSPTPAEPNQARVPPSADSEQPPSWRRFQIAAGVELHVRSDAVKDQAALIEQLLKISQTATGRNPQTYPAFESEGRQHA
jgi:DNA-binding transcriptional MerR regulator